MNINMEKGSRTPVLERLNLKTKKDPVTGCWLWQGTTNSSGHGQIHFNDKMIYVHRVSAHIHFKFDLTSKSLICHKTTCPNPSCWNPEHLYVGTHPENVKDAILTGRHKIWGRK